MSKRKILVLSDHSAGITGFSCVAHNILDSLVNTKLYDIVQIGINYDGEGYDLEKHPYRIVPAVANLNDKYKDVYGRNRVIDALKSGQIDILFMIQDMGIVQTFSERIRKTWESLPADKKFITILYTPVDSALYTKRDWVVKSLSLMDYPVVYTHWGKKEVSQFDPDLEKRALVCHHGVDTSVFKPLSLEEREKGRKELLGPDTQHEGKFIILNLNRNQIRKDYVKTFLTLKELKKRDPNVFLIAFAAVQDQGGDLIEIATQCGCELGKDWAVPNKYNPTRGYTTEQLNKIYNLSDCCFSSTTGEGWGLSSTESMATKTPCVFPNNTSLTEIFGSDGERGRLIACGDDSNNFICHGAFDSSLVRPTINVYDAVEKLLWVKQGGPQVEAMVDRAYEWAKEHSWPKINTFWIDLFEHAWENLQRGRQKKR